MSDATRSFARAWSTAAAAVVLAVCPVLAKAQITLTENWLFEGDVTYAVATVDSFGGAQAQIGITGAQQSWDFSELPFETPNLTATLSVFDAQQGGIPDSFPEANLVLRSSRQFGLIGATNEAYLRRTDDRVEIIGIADTDTASLVPPFTFPEALSLQEVPLSFGDAYSDATQLRIPFAPELLAATLGDSSFLGFIDSVGVTVGQALTVEVDGYGTLLIGEDSTEVLRLRTVTEAIQRFEVKVPFLGWVDIESQIEVPDSISNPPPARTEDISWVSEQSSYPLVRVFLTGAGEAGGVEWLQGEASSVRELEPLNASLRVYPSASGTVRVDYFAAAGLPSGTRLLVSDALGRQLYNRPLPGSTLRQAEGSVELAASAWPKGLLVVQLRAPGYQPMSERTVYLGQR